MIKIIELTEIHLPTGAVHYTCLWQDTEKSRKTTDDQWDGLIVGVGKGDAQTLIEKSTRKEESKQINGADNGKSIKYFFDQSQQASDSEEINESDFVILKGVLNVDYNNIQMTVTELVKNEEGKTSHVKCAWNDHLQNDDYTIKTVKTGTFPIAAVAKYKNMTRRYMNTI